MMTWKELKEAIEELTEEQQNMDVSVYLEETDEYIPMSGLGVTLEDDVLDEDSPFIIIDF